MANRSRTFISAFLLVSLLFCALAIVALNQYQTTYACFDNRPPLRSFIASVDEYQQRWFIEPSQNFADRNGFKFNISYFDQHGREFLIDMIRKDVEVVLSNNVTDLEKFDVAFYNYDCIHPTVASDIDGLVRELKSSLQEDIPNVKITEEQ